MRTSGKDSNSRATGKNELMLPNILREVDHIVLLPRVSRHILVGSTHGLKSAVGWLRDDTRLELHRDAATLMQKCAEINGLETLRGKVRLCLSVATKVQTPLSGRIWDLRRNPIRASFSVPSPSLHTT